ncbi:MAG: M16 family metallopeptidase [Bacteroidales bacterium]
MIAQEFRKKRPDIKPIDPVALISPENYRLDNGSEVFAIHAGTEDLLRIDLIFEAGSIYQNQSLTAHFANKCITEGTASFTSKEIATTVDFYGAYLKTVATRDDSRISLYCLTRHLEILLPLLQETAFRATFPEDEIRTIAGKSKQEFLVNMQKVKYMARHYFGSLIFGDDHPYGRYSRAEDYDLVEPQMLVDFYDSYYRQAPFRLIVAGKLPADIDKTLNRYFGKHTTENHEPQKVEIPEAAPAQQQEHRMEKPGALQSAFRIGRPLFSKLHPDFLKFQVLNTVLGGYFGSRLMSNIREDKGYTYGIGSMASSLRHDGMFVIASEVGNDVTRAAIDEVFHEIGRLQRDLVPEEELRLVKNYLHGSFLRSADGPFALAELVKSASDFGLGMDFFQHYLETIKNITAEEIRDLAVKYLQPDSLVRLVVGKKD